jgi:hypothetical protein
MGIACFIPPTRFSGISSNGFVFGWLQSTMGQLGWWARDRPKRRSARPARGRGDQNGHEGRERKGHRLSHSRRALVQIRGLSWRAEAALTRVGGGECDAEQVQASPERLKGGQPARNPRFRGSGDVNIAHPWSAGRMGHRREAQVRRWFGCRCSAIGGCEATSASALSHAW